MKKLLPRKQNKKKNIKKETMTSKFQLGDLVYLMIDNKIQHKKIRMIDFPKLSLPPTGSVIVSGPIKYAFSKDMFLRDSSGGVKDFLYSQDTIFNTPFFACEGDCYSTREELIKNL